MSKKTLEDLRNEAIEMLENDDELFCNMVEELDSWNGYADGYRAYEMGELDEQYYDCPASKIINDLTEDFSINDNYFYFSIYGLESCDDKSELYRDNTTEDEVLDAVLDYYPHLYFSDSDFKDLIEEIDNYDEDDEDEEEESEEEEIEA